MKSKMADADSELGHVVRAGTIGLLSIVIYLLLAYHLDGVFAKDQRYDNPYLMSQIVSLSVTLMLGFALYCVSFGIPIEDAHGAFNRYVTTQMLGAIAGTFLFYLLLKAFGASCRTPRMQRAVNVVLRALTMGAVSVTCYALMRTWVFIPSA